MAVVWRWRSTALVAVVLVCCWLVTTGITDPDFSPVGMARSAGLIAYPALLAAFLMLELHGRVSGTGVSPWLAVGVALIATQGLLLTLESWDAPSCCPPGWPLLADALLAVLLLILAGLVAVPLRVDPGMASLAGGFALASAHLVVRTPGPDLSIPLRWTMLCLLAVAGIVLAVRLVTVTDLPLQAAGSLAAGVVALLAGRLATDALPAENPAVSLFVVSAEVFGAALACGVFAELLREDVVRAQQRAVRVDEELTALRSQVRIHREQLHEARATVAGILSASVLLGQDGALDDAMRRRLADMLHPETVRLQRLLAEGVAARQPFDLDEAIEPVILTHRAAGQIIDWERGDRWVVARRDDVTQLVRILLDNAAMHAPGATVSVGGTERDGWVELTVADDGPGPPTDLGEQIFDWGTRGEHSPGSGIGLNLARRLAESSNGYLRLARGEVGAVFVVGLPSVQPESGET
ncbi:sensor histidine kinase [Nocardioides sp. T2.26MG-1]|uniref:sensor histidine kinase n=1 Tax=Nocardioides sp. T2.26MG-1 TaxID=3041166 RepID=UPI002541E0A3|nr:HAMP domain-containing sensor histidine kinase [Nocardioides sp. T2.26MG-1]